MKLDSLDYLELIREKLTLNSISQSSNSVVAYTCKLIHLYSGNTYMGCVQEGTLWGPGEFTLVGETYLLGKWNCDV